MQFKTFLCLLFAGSVLLSASATHAQPAPTVGSPPYCPKIELFTVGDLTTFSSVRCANNCTSSDQLLLLFYRSPDVPNGSQLACAANPDCDECKSPFTPVGSGGTGGSGSVDVEAMDFDGSIKHGISANLRINEMYYAQVGEEDDAIYFVTFQFSARVLGGLRPYLKSKVAIRIADLPEGARAFMARRLVDDEGYDVLRFSNGAKVVQYPVVESELYRDRYFTERSSLPIMNNSN